MTPQEEKFSFRWGIPLLDEGFTQIPNHFFRVYSRLISRTEWLFICHLSTYQYESREGECRPSLQTIAREMGYQNVRSAQLLRASLENKKYLTVVYRPGRESLYCFKKLSEALMALTPETSFTPEKIFIPDSLRDEPEITPPLKPISYEEEKQGNNGSEEKEPGSSKPGPNGRFSGLGDLTDPAGPLLMAAHCEKAQAGPDAIQTVPPEAGGRDGLGEAMVNAWAEAKSVDYMPDALRKEWARALAKMARKSGLMTAEDGDPVLTAEQAAQAVRTVLDRTSEKWGFYNQKGVFTNPHVEGFKRAWVEVALGLVQAGSGDNGTTMEGHMGAGDRWKFDVG